MNAAFKTVIQGYFMKDNLFLRIVFIEDFHFKECLLFDRMLSYDVCFFHYYLLLFLSLFTSFVNNCPLSCSAKTLECSRVFDAQS